MAKSFHFSNQLCHIIGRDSFNSILNHPHVTNKGMIIGTLRSYYSDGNENVKKKKQLDLMARTKALHVGCKFWYISSSYLNKQRHEMAKILIQGEDTMENLSFSASTWMQFPPVLFLDTSDTLYKFKNILV